MFVTGQVAVAVWSFDVEKNCLAWVENDSVGTVREPNWKTAVGTLKQ